MDYAKRFKEIMKERNLTQQDLAKLAGVRQQSISNWMGKRYPNPKYIEKICEALGMKLVEFYGTKEDLMAIYNLSPEAIRIGKAIDQLPAEKKERLFGMLNDQLLPLLQADRQ